ncbi:7SK snRNA methylphosphate capping enzyme-like [Argonauta hians]
MSAVDLKTAVKAHFELSDFKCRPPTSAEASVLTKAKVKSPSANVVRPMGDLENSRGRSNFDTENEPAKQGRGGMAGTGGGGGGGGGGFGGGGGGDGVKFSYPIHRKRPRFLSRSGGPADNYHNKKRRKGEKIILPTKFLLGGNINDPLNLNSLCDEEVNRALNERTPQSSPVPTPAHRRDVAVVMPRNQFDPLNLNEPDMENEPLTPAKMSAKRKKRHKVRKKSEGSGTAAGDPLATPTAPACLSKEAEKKKNLAEALKIEIDDEPPPPQQAPEGAHPPPPLNTTTTTPITGGSSTNTATSTPVVAMATPRHSSSRSAMTPLTLSVSAPLLSSLSSGGGAVMSGTTTGSSGGDAVAENHKGKSEDKIVSPVIPQLSPKNRRRRLASFSDSRTSDSSSNAPSSFSTSSHHHNKNPAGRASAAEGGGNCGTNSESQQQQGKLPVSSATATTTAATSTPNVTRKIRRRQSNRGGKGGNSANSKSSRFVYGNYNRYYGYRNSNDTDHRTNCFKREWFEDKKVLDIGCNVGHLTLFIAREFKPQMIVGLDIDGKLISAARNNIRYYMSQGDQNKFPASCKLSYGPLAAPIHQETQRRVFPHNVSFRQGNYVPENDDFLDLQKADYDLILAMSLTKWIHLNWGDAGLKRAFRRMYRHLRPGGKLILEPQAWGSYKKRKWISENIRKNFEKLQLKPENFAEYLIDQVGFSRYEVIDVPFNRAKGFQRPIFLFHKDPVPCSPVLQQQHGEPSALPGGDPQVMVPATDICTAYAPSSSIITTTTAATTTTTTTNTNTTSKSESEHKTFGVAALRCAGRTLGSPGDGGGGDGGGSGGGIDVNVNGLDHDYDGDDGGVHDDMSRICSRNNDDDGVGGSGGGDATLAMDCTTSNSLASYGTTSSSSSSSSSSTTTTTTSRIHSSSSGDGGADTKQLEGMEIEASVIAATLAAAKTAATAKTAAETVAVAAAVAAAQNFPFASFSSSSSSSSSSSNTHSTTPTPRPTSSSSPSSTSSSSSSSSSTSSVSSSTLQTSALIPPPPPPSSTNTTTAATTTTTDTSTTSSTSDM